VQAIPLPHPGFGRPVSNPFDAGSPFLYPKGFLHDVNVAAQVLRNEAEVANLLSSRQN